MHPRNLTPALTDKYGIPQVRRVFGLSSAYFNPGQFPGWAIARSLAEGNFLTEKGRAALLSSPPTTHAEWGKIAEIEGIPSRGYTAPFATEQLQRLPQRAKLSEVTFDQDTFNTLYACLRLHATSAAAVKTATYPLLDGPPGASKSLIANICAALLQLPVVTVTGSDGSADELKIELFGGDNASSKDIAGVVRDYLYQGWIFHPLSRKLAALEQQKMPFGAFRTEILIEIAQLEGIKENITAYMPGKYQLAAMHGYLLFLDETNGFKGVTTLLTQMLENYTTELHPTFFIMGAMNPAGEKHNREPLPPEIRSRFNTIPVPPPTDDSYYQMLTYYFSGEQPAINLPGGAVGPVTPAMLGITIPNRELGALKRSLTAGAFTTFLGNFAKFHKAVELKLEDGVLDPKNGTNGSQETLSVDRRTLFKSVVALDTFISLKQERSNDLAGDVLDWDQYHRLDLASINQALILDAMEEAFELFYVTPFNFGIAEEIEVTKGTKKEFKSASELVRFLLGFHNLTRDKLTAYIKTTDDIVKTRAAWEQRFKASDLYEATQTEAVIKQAVDEEIRPEEKHVYFLRNKQTHQVSVCDLSYLGTADARKGYIKQEYPQMVLKGSTGTSVISVLDRRLGALAAKKKRFICREELGHFTDALQKMLAKHKDHPFYIPVYDAPAETMAIVLCIPYSALPAAVVEGLRAKDTSRRDHLTQMVNLRKNTGILNSDDLSALVAGAAKRVAPDAALALDGIKDDIILELTVLT